MKILKRIAIGIFILILLIVLISFFLPSKVHVERSVEMNAKPDVVFGIINDLDKWKQWSPFIEMDTTATMVYSEPSEGVGAWYTWNGKNSGEGKLTIIQSTPYSFINCEMNFGAMGIATGAFKIDSVANGVKVTWSLDSDGEGISWYFYVMSKYLYMVMDKNLGQEFEKGLNKIKQIAEDIPQKETVAGFDVEEKILTGINILSIRETVKNSEIGMKIGQNYTLIGQYMTKAKISVTGSPLIILHAMQADDCEIEFAIPVDSTAKTSGKIIFSELPSTNAIVVKYFGSYSKTASLYDAVNKYIESKGKKISGPSREVYITDPGIEKDTAKWLTEIVFPVE